MPICKDCGEKFQYDGTGQPCPKCLPRTRVIGQGCPVAPEPVKEYGVSPADFRLPVLPSARKAIPLATGCLDYFPDAMAAVAALSKVGNDQHNPGQPLHWDRTKSTDHADCLLRHLVDRGTTDTDGIRHSAKVAWRALALLQTEIENARK